MANVHRYRPAFFTGFEDPADEQQADNLEQLMAIPWVGGKPRPGFHRFSKSENCLMVEYDGGAEWWVIAHLDQPELYDLPEWDYGAANKAELARKRSRNV